MKCLRGVIVATSCSTLALALGVGLSASGLGQSLEAQQQPVATAQTVYANSTGVPAESLVGSWVGPTTNANLTYRTVGGNPYVIVNGNGTVTHANLTYRTVGSFLNGNGTVTADANPYVIVNGNGTVTLAPRPPEGAVYHQVVDRYIDRDGNPIEVRSKTHVVDMDCSPGRRTNELVAGIHDDGRGNVWFGQEAPREQVAQAQ
jgi:hypothetical protein